MHYENFLLEAKLLTPLFMSGANQEAAEFRVASIKGALRFWWRATHADANHEHLNEKESLLFGSPHGEGRSKVVISLSEKNLSTSNADFCRNQYGVRRRIQKGRGGHDTTQKILQYLAYGPIAANREYFKPGGTFKLIIQVRDQAISKADILHLFQLMGTFGGLGSGARNGYGRFELLGQAPIDPKTLINPYIGQPKMPYTAFSNQYTLFQLPQAQASWQNALFQLGKAYLASRVNYHNTSTYTSQGLEREHSYEQRKFIAFPLRNEKIGNTGIERHAKSHFFGLLKTAENQYSGYLLHLPSKYLGDLDKNGSLDQQYQRIHQAFNQNLVRNGLKQTL
jgi:CRISPR-associated protein Cmr1